MRVLIADDEKGLRDSIAEYLELDGIEVLTAGNGLSTLRMLEDEDFDVLITDLKMPGADGLEVLRRLRDSDSDLPVIMVSAFGDVGDAVEAMKLGAEDYLVKPFESEELRLKVLKAGEKRRLQLEINRLKNLDSRGFSIKSVNSQMLRIIKLADKAAPTSASVLITGESGTGKEVFARYIHSKSERSDRPFVAVNVGSLPESLLESELFGHEKGAFTGADRMKTGMFEAANGGTLFLDEIGDMPFHLQVKLLRALQERTIQRIGSVRQIKLDVRIIAATNRSIEDGVRNGTFREDLFYRLNVVRIELPALRERIEDIPVLCGIFISGMNHKMGRNVSGISAEALSQLKSYSFPGNIRELENLVERAFILTDSDELQDADFSLQPVDRGLSDSILKSRRNKFKGTLKELESEVIKDSLIRWEGRKVKAAEELGIDRKTLFNKIKEYGLEGIQKAID
jgi:two-component system response regulator AtoC